MAQVRYTVSMPHPNSHLFHVRMDVKGIPGATTDFVMPVWTPGSYKVREFSRNVQEFSAGKHSWRKIEKNRWRVQAGGDVTIEYKVWAFELTVQTSHLDVDHGYINGASLFLYVDGHKDAPVEVDLRPARGWKVATGLSKRGRFRTAPDYDVLIDSPIEMGTFDRYSFKVRNVPHHLVIHGRGNYVPERLVADVRRIVETEIKIMRHVPYRDYTFILHNTVERGGGGLEHLNSTSLQYPPNLYRPREKYLNFMELVAHEFWHLWNVKRIHPEMLGPFDYEREVYTTLLWVMEGVTSYYDTLVPCRAGLAGPDHYFKRMAERIQRYEDKPGRKRQSLSQSSFDTWVKLYIPNENSLNSQMSYYEKGELVGMCLDLEIRKRTGNRKSLDDVMRSLYADYGREGRGFPEPEFRRACERAAGGLDRFFADYVEGVADIPWNRFLGYAGVKLGKQIKKNEDDGKPRRNRAWLGMVTQRAGGAVTVSQVIEGSPAWRSGLSAKDEIIAMDGVRIVPDEWEKRVSEREPGEQVRFSFFRAGHLREVPVKLGAKENVTLAFRKVKSPTPLQKKIFEGWTWARWDRKKKR